MYYFIFLIFLVLSTVTMYYFGSRDILEPHVLLFALFSMAASFALYFYNYWKLNDYSGKTVFTILLGLVCYALGSGLAHMFCLRKKPSFEEIHIIRFSRINTNFIIQICISVISFVILAIFVLYFRRSVQTDSVAGMISLYKEFRTDSESDFPTYINLLIKICCGFAHIGLFIFLNNMISNKRRRRDFLLLIPIISYVIICTLSANRGDILMLSIGGFFAGYILYCRKNGWSSKRSNVAVKKGIKYGIVILVLFWAFLMYTGRAVNSGDKHIITYLFSYISGPLASFDLYIKQGGTPVNRWGEETFVALNNNLYAIFKYGEPSQRYLEFRTTTSYSTTNIYTSFRRFFHDFGYNGVIYLSFIQGWITSLVYKSVKTNHIRKTDVDFIICFYCFFAYTIVYTLVDELFYSSNISISGLIKILILYMCYRIYFYKSYQDVEVTNLIERH